MKTDNTVVGNAKTSKASEGSATPSGETAAGKTKKRAVAAVTPGTSLKKRQRKTYHTWRVVMRTSASLPDALRNYCHEFQARKEGATDAPEGSLAGPPEVAPIPGVPSFFGEPEPPSRRRVVIVKELSEKLLNALGRHENFAAARQLLARWKNELLPGIPKGAPSLDWLEDLQWEGGETGFRAEVVEDLTLLVEAFSRPVRFYNRMAPHHEVLPGHFGPYPKRKEIDVSAEEREFAASTLGQTLSAFGVAALLNEKLRRVFLDLSRHPHDFAMMLAIAEGRDVAATYGRPRKKDGPDAERAKKKRPVLEFYWAIRIFLDQDASIAERNTSVRFLKAYCQWPEVPHEIRVELKEHLLALRGRRFVEREAKRSALEVTCIAFPKPERASIGKLVRGNPPVRSSALDETTGEILRSPAPELTGGSVRAVRPSA